MVFPSWLRACAAMIVMTGLLGLGAGCKRSNSNADTASLSGTVSYSRQTILRDGDGAATGLGASSQFAARGVVVRLFQLYLDLQADGRMHQNWRLINTGVTDANGGYTIGGAVKGHPTLVEVDSVFQQAGGHGSSIQILADPAGIASALPQPQRPIYAIRKNLAGTVVDNPVASPDTAAIDPQTPLLAGNTTVNFVLGASDAWVATLSTWHVPGSNPDPGQPGTQAPPSATGLLMGSRLLAILDSAYVFSATFGDPTPSRVNGGVLDLHYFPGLPAAGPRSYVIYDPAKAPLSAAGAGKPVHYFATLSGGPGAGNPSAPDDAMDPGAIYPILARNFLSGQGKTALFATGHSELASLSPDLALVDGLADAMAATLLRTPWLTDLASVTALTPRDIRAGLQPQRGFTSPGILSAAAWRLTLDAYGLPSPGNPAAWAGIADPTIIARLYGLIDPSITIDARVGTAVAQTDIPNMYAQVGRLQETQANIFTNLNLLAVLGPFGVIWPQPPQTAPAFSADWGLNPDSQLAPLPSFPLSMADAVKIADVSIGHGADIFPNVSLREVFYAKLAITNDERYTISAATVPALDPASAVLEVAVDGNDDLTFTLSAARPTTPEFTLRGNPRDANNPARHFIRIRVLSPDVVQPDVTTTVTLDRTGPA